MIVTSFRWMVANSDESVCRTGIVPSKAIVLFLTKYFEKGIIIVHCGIEQWQLFCLIRRRSWVRIPLPQYLVFRVCSGQANKFFRVQNKTYNLSFECPFRLVWLGRQPLKLLTLGSNPARDICFVSVADLLYCCFLLKTA